jgi:hypothetical protein
MKKQATAMALGTILTLVMTATSFAANGTAVHHGRSGAANYNGFYDSAVGTSGYDDYSAGANSGSMGARGR